MTSKRIGAVLVAVLLVVGAVLLRTNVLDDDDVRQGVKDFSNWPTVPQLYVNGQFVGGSDIMTEMFESGELQTLLKDAKVV